MITKCRCRTRLQGVGGELVIGENDAFCAATLIERMPQHLLLVGLDGQNSDGVANALIGQANALPNVMQASLTWDKGSKVARRAALTPANKTQVYLAGSHSPWRRPSNEARKQRMRYAFGGYVTSESSSNNSCSAYSAFFPRLDISGRRILLCP